MLTTKPSTVYDVAGIPDHGWFTDNPAIREKACLCASYSMLVHAISSAAGEKRTIADAFLKVAEMPEFRDMSKGKLILGLLPFSNDVSVLRLSKSLLTEPWSLAAFQSKGNYEPEMRTTPWGVSVVVFYRFEPTVKAAFDEYLKNLGGNFQFTARPHFTIASIQVDLPSAEADKQCGDFQIAWAEALRNQTGFCDVIRKMLQCPKLRSDELRLQGQAAVLFGSNANGFLDAAHELRLRIMKSILPKQAPLSGRRTQPLWVHSVLGRKCGDLNGVTPFQEWPSADLPERMILQDPYLALMVFADEKALLDPVKEFRLSLVA